MTFSIIVFLYLYFLFVLAWLIFSLIALYHIIRYGQISLISFLAIFAYLAVSALIFYFSFYFLSQIDWSHELITLNGLGSFNFDGFPGLLK